MPVLLPNRTLALRRRTYTTDSHGDRVASGFLPPTAAYPGLATIGPDVPLGQPGGRPWTLAADPALWPVAQQDMITDPVSGQQWQVTSADLITHSLLPLLDYIRVEAHLYTGGTRA